MPSLEKKHLSYVNAKQMSEDKFNRLRDLMQIYTTAKSSGKLPRLSKVLLKPSNLRACEPDTYSLDLRFNGKDRVIANNLIINDPKLDLIVPEKQPFECDVTKKLEYFTAELYNFKGDLISSGSSWLFSKFARAETIITEKGISCLAQTEYFLIITNLNFVECY